eukprot:TRINITY_DN28246_c0_g1_i1.p1 TRINITY_DN28246_c0_g1~~TRINITY_DN28246_c0_g1_i1.p1  ORF type:complete len:196 (+),score=13.95 TRINITY_DN28246_c0_g1_i1:255-842(+)
MVVLFVSEDSVRSIAPVTFEQHQVTEDGEREWRALKLRTFYSRTLSRERVRREALARASRLERKAKAYNRERSRQPPMPHSVCDDVVEGERHPSAPVPETLDDETTRRAEAAAASGKTAARTRSSSFARLRTRLGKSWFSRSDKVVDVSTKPSVFTSLRSGFVSERPWYTRLRKRDPDTSMRKSSSDHLNFDSIY